MVKLPVIWLIPKKWSNCQVTVKNRWSKDKKSVKKILHLRAFYHQFSTSCMTKKCTVFENYQKKMSHFITYVLAAVKTVFNSNENCFDYCEICFNKVLARKFKYIHLGNKRKWCKMRLFCIFSNTLQRKGKNNFFSWFCIWVTLPAAIELKMALLHREQLQVFSTKLVFANVWQWPSSRASPSLEKNVTQDRNEAFIRIKP